MNFLPRIRLSTGKAVLAILLLGLPAALSALEPPTREQLARYRLDGTLAQRLAFARSLGNDQVEPGLVIDFQNRMERLRLKSQGLSDAEIDRILPTYPSGIRPSLKSKGTVKMFVLLIEFPDYASSQTRDSIHGKVFGDGDSSAFPLESLRNYYRRSSYNQLDIQGSTLGWYKPAYNRSSIAQTWQARENLIKEALNYFDGQGHDFSQYDNDGNGVIDYFLVVWTGPDNGWSNFWWGYVTSWSSSFSLDGKQFGGMRYSWQWEARPYPGTFSPRVMIHETGHGLGLPDLYDYSDADGPKGGVGGLDIMDSNAGDHNGFSKMLLDWLTPQTIGSGGQTFLLRPAASQPDAVIFWPLYSLSNPFREFFMVQNRYRTANDSNFPADGLLIWHVDASLTGSNTWAWDNSWTSHKLVRLMEADGLEQIEKNQGGNAGDFYVPGKAFNKSTTPNSNAYNGTLTNAFLDGIVSAGANMSCNIAFDAKTLQIAVNNAALGTTSPLPGTYSYGIGADVVVTAIAAQYCALTSWSGDASGNAYSLTVNMSRDKTVTANFKLVSPPANVTAVRLKNRSVIQTEHIVDLTWEENPANSGLTIVAYRVYVQQQGSWVQLADLGPAERSFRQRMVPAAAQTYGVSAVNQGGVESTKAQVVK